MRKFEDHAYRITTVLSWNRTNFYCEKDLLTSLSGVTRLGHTGAHALATRDCAPPVQVCIRIIGADSKLSLSNADRSLNGLQIGRHSIAMFIYRITCLVYAHRTSASLPYIKVTYTALQYGLRTDLGDCQIPKILCPRLL